MAGGGNMKIHNPQVWREYRNSLVYNITHILQLARCRLYAQTHTHIIYIHTYTHTDIYIHIHTHTYIYIYTHKCIYIYIYIHIQYIYIYIHMHTYILAIYEYFTRFHQHFLSPFSQSPERSRSRTMVQGS